MMMMAIDWTGLETPGVSEVTRIPVATEAFVLASSVARLVRD